MKDNSQVTEMLHDILDGSGWSTDDYILNAKHSPLSNKEKVTLVLKLAKAGKLADVDKLQGKETEFEEVPEEALMSPKDVMAKYGKGNIPTNEGIAFKPELNKRKNTPNGNVVVTVNGDDYVFAYSADEIGTEPYGVVLPDDNVVTFFNKSKTAKSIYNKTGTQLRKWRKDNSSKLENITEARQKYSKPNAKAKKELKGMFKMKAPKGQMLNFIYYDKKKKKWWFVDFEGDLAELLNDYTLGQVNDYIQKNQININESNSGFNDKLANHDMKHKGEYRVAKKLLQKVGGEEMDFYDELETLHDKLGHIKYIQWLSGALKGHKVDMWKDPKIKNKAEAEEALYLLSK